MSPLPSRPPADAPASGESLDAGFRAVLQEVLEGFVDRQAAAVAALGTDAARLVEEGRLAVSGGKRFRASFCRWGYRAVEPEPADPDALLRACAALEVLHASALAHDDYMDASATRRGHPTTHESFARDHRRLAWPGDAGRYGAAAAILLGDLLLSWADELMRTCGLPADRVREAMALFDRCKVEVILGQFLDVSVQARGRADVQAAMTVVRYKSAKYSVERPLHIGAALAGGPPELLGDLSAVGLPLGEAFQLRDDLLGVFGDPATTGKPAGDDLVEGKRTVLVALALDGADADDAALLDRSLGTPLGEAEVSRLRRVIDASGARAQVEAAIDDLTATARSALGRARIAEPAREALGALAAAVTDRVV